MKKCVERPKLPKLSQEEINTLNSPLYMKDMHT